MTDTDQQNAENQVVSAPPVQLDSEQLACSPGDSEFPPSVASEVAQPNDLRPAVLEVAYHSLAPQSLVFEQRTSYVGACVVSCIAFLVAVPFLIAFAANGWWVVAAGVVGWLLLAGVLFYGAHVWPQLSFRHTRWRLNETGLEIQRGVWWKHQIAVPTARVQHVDVSQGPVQRLFELGTLTVHTAGTINASVELAGLEHSQALSLRDQLIQQKESLDVT